MCASPTILTVGASPGRSRAHSKHCCVAALKQPSQQKPRHVRHSAGVESSVKERGPLLTALASDSRLPLDPTELESEENKDVSSAPAPVHRSYAQHGRVAMLQLGHPATCARSSSPKLSSAASGSGVCSAHSPAMLNLAPYEPLKSVRYLRSPGSAEATRAAALERTVRSPSG